MSSDNFIPYGRQLIDAEDIRAVIKILKSDWLTQGPAVDQFEREFAAFCGARYAVAVSSGTAALHLSAIAAGFGPGDEVITTPITFVATSNSILYTGATPFFADIDPETACIDIKNISSRINGRTRGIIPVHFAGQPCDMEAIAGLSKKVTIIEDAAHALGAQYKVQGKWFKVGSCAHSDMTIFSLHPVKHIAAGEGGVITTNSSELASRLRMLRTHGITRENALMEQNPGPWWYEMQELGYNYRITDIQCALAASQLKKIEGFVERRREIVKKYNEAFKDNPYIEVLTERSWARSSWHIYVILCKGVDRDRMFHALRAEGLGVNVHYIPVYRQPFYVKKGSGSPSDFPESENYYNKAITIPLFPAMTERQVARVIDTVNTCAKDLAT